MTSGLNTYIFFDLEESKNQKFVFNMAKSIRIANEMKNQNIEIKKNACYHNVFYTQNNTKYDIVYCYVEHPLLTGQNNNKVFIRHCMFVDIKNKEYICPTFGKYSNNEITGMILPFAFIKNSFYNKYLVTFLKTKCPDGRVSYNPSKKIKQEQSFEAEMMKNNYFALGDL